MDEKAVDLRDALAGSKESPGGDQTTDSGEKKKSKLMILVVLALMLIASLIIFFPKLTGPEIPEEALENPERGLPIED